MGHHRGNVLIVGCGYVGCPLAELLIKKGYGVTGIRQSQRNLPEGVTLLVGDILDKEFLARISSDFTHIVYMIGARSSTEKAYHDAYVKGLMSVIDGVSARQRQLEKFIFVSSTGVYGQNNGQWVDECSETSPTDFKGQTLLAGETLALQLNTTATIVRFGGIYGPGRVQLIRSLAAPTLSKYPDLMCYTNRIHQIDCARLLTFLIELPEIQQIYLGVDDEPTRRDELMTWLATEMNVPNPVTDDLTPSKRGESGKRCSNRRIHEAGFTFQYPTFREGYRELLKERET